VVVPLVPRPELSPRGKCSFQGRAGAGVHVVVVTLQYTFEEVWTFAVYVVPWLVSGGLGYGGCNCRIRHGRSWGWQWCPSLPAGECRIYMSGIVTPIAGGGLPVLRYEDAMSRNHEMRWYMLCHHHVNLSDAVIDGVPVSPRPRLILNVQNLAKWGKCSPQCVF